MWSQKAKQIVMRNFQRVIVEQQTIHVYHLNNSGINSIELLSQCFKAIAPHQQTLNEEASVTLYITQYITPRPEMSLENCSVLVNSNWSPRIKSMRINRCNIDAAKCRELSKGKWNNIEFIDLGYNCINDMGVFYLCQADWKTVKIVVLRRNNLQGEACLYLSKVWPKLEYIDLYQNTIGIVGCLHLSKAEWPLLTYLDIGKNKIGAKGCLHLSKVNFPNFVCLALYGNPISDEGCKYLASGQWPLLQTMKLDSCRLGEKAAKHLSKSCWPNLKHLNLNYNKMGLRGCKYLCRGKWDNLEYLQLSNNRVQSKGCEELTKVVWNKMKSVSLYGISINREDYRYLSSRKWQIYWNKSFEE